MGLDRSQWFENIKSSLRELAQKTGETLNRLGATTVWGGLMAAVVLPVLEAASRQPEKVQEILVATLASVGGNLLANRVERWRQLATPTREAVRELEEAVLAEPALAGEVERVIQNLHQLGMPVLSELAQSGREERGAVLDRLAGELAIHHNAGRFRSLAIVAGGDVDVHREHLPLLCGTPAALTLLGREPKKILRTGGCLPDLGDRIIRWFASPGTMPWPIVVGEPRRPNLWCLSQQRPSGKKRLVAGREGPGRGETSGMRIGPTQSREALAVLRLSESTRTGKVRSTFST
jgi:hypothetical protein